MSKKQYTAYLSFLPLIIIILIIAGAGYLLTKNDFKFKLWRARTDRRKLNGYPAQLEVSTEKEKRQAVITSEAELQEFLTYVDPTKTIRVDEKINFEKEMVIGVSSSTFESLATKFKINKVYEDKEKQELLVSTKSTEYFDNCPTEQGNNIIVDMVAIPKTDWKIDFETLKEQLPCDTDETTN